MQDKRITNFDILRGISMILILFFHTSIYNFAEIHKIDFSNPPIVVTVMSIMMLWGGLFIIYSGLINTLVWLDRKTPYKYFLLAALVYFIVHYVLVYFLGRWSVDLVNNQPDMTFVARTIRGMQFSFPSTHKLLEGSSVSTIAINLIIVGILLKKIKGYLLPIVSASAIMLLSFVRVYMFDFFAHSSGFLSLVYSFFIANPYPLLPYASYALIGMVIGKMIHDKRKDLMKKVIFPIGIFFFIYGLIGALQFDKSISKSDFFWYFKTNLELGIFMLLIYLVSVIKLPKISLLTWFSRISLTIYLLETLVSEVLGKISTQLIPLWNMTIEGALMFGAFNVLVWIVILFFWSRSNFRYSFEYYWVRLFEKFGKKSTKLDNI